MFIVGVVMWNFVVTKNNLEMIPFVHVNYEEVCADKFICLNECVEECKVNINKLGKCLFGVK